MPIPIQIGDIIETKKQHPCGAKKFIIMRTGMDFRMQCSGCQKQIWIERAKLEKRIKRITRNGENVEF